MDYRIPFLETALDLPQAQSQLRTVIPNLSAVVAATLIRHKRGRRALIEYHLETSDGPSTVLGKIRAKGTDWQSYQVQQGLWNQGFGIHSPDGIAVPEPLGVIPSWHMWLQRKVAGVTATELLPSDQGVAVVRRIAALAHKLHQRPIPTPKAHTLEDELQILRDRLPLVVQQYPHWQSRLERLLDRCYALADSAFAPPLPCTHIHRDFYADQILVDGDRLWLLDLDLYCHGDPAIDLGNFIAHIIEQSLRQLSDPAAMGDREVALQAAYIAACKLAPEQQQRFRRAIELYTGLTLVRHIHISTRIPERRPYTEAILALCESRLGAVARLWPS